MPETDSDSEEGAETAIAPELGKPVSSEPLAFLKAANRDFAEGEIANTITIRFLMEKVSDLQRAVSDLRPFQELYYRERTDLAIERGRSHLGKKQEITSSVLLGLGAAGMGVASNYLIQSRLAVIAFIVSSLVLASALYLKAPSK